MATPEQDIMTALLADSGVRGLIGNGGTDVYAGLLARNIAGPSIEFGRISTTRNEGSGSYTLDRGYTGFCWARFQFDCWAADYDTSARLATPVRLLICRLDLTGGGKSQANIILGERDLPVPNMIQQFRRVIDAKIWFLEEGRDG